MTILTQFVFVQARDVTDLEGYEERHDEALLQAVDNDEYLINQGTEGGPERFQNRISLLRRLIDDILINIENQIECPSE